MNVNETRIIAFLNQLPIGTIVTLAGVAGALYGLFSGELNYVEFSAAIGFSGVGGGAIGVARNGASHGVGTAKVQKYQKVKVPVESEAGSDESTEETWIR